MMTSVCQNQSTVNKNSDLCAFFIAETFICQILSVFVKIPLLSVWVTIFLLTAVLINNRFCIYIRLTSNFLKLIVVITILLVSAYRNGIESVIEYATYFMVFGITSFVFLSYELSVKRLFKTLSIIYLIYIVVYITAIRVEFIESDNYWAIQMGVAYGFASIILLNVLIFVLPDLYDGKLIFPIITGVLATYFMLVDTGTRGALVIVIVGCVCIYSVKKGSWRFVLLMAAFALLTIVVIKNYREILIWLASFLSEWNIEIKAINKMLNMMANNEEANGRDFLSKISYDEFIEAQFIGHGVGYFEKKYSTYPHNILWQLLIEYGLIGMVVIVLFAVVRLKQMVIEKKNEFGYLGLLFVVSAIPMLFFSNSYWLCPTFWLFFFFDKRQLSSHELVKSSMHKKN